MSGEIITIKQDFDVVEIESQDEESVVIVTTPNQTLIPTSAYTPIFTGGAGAEPTVTLPVFENLQAGDLVSIFNDAGTYKVRKAIATSFNTLANGFVKVNRFAGQSVEVFYSGINEGSFSLTQGPVYLSATVAGQVTNVAPSNTGQVRQSVGVALNSNSYIFNTDYGIVISS